MPRETDIQSNERINSIVYIFGAGVNSSINKYILYNDDELRFQSQILARVFSSKPKPPVTTKFGTINDAQSKTQMKSATNVKSYYINNKLYYVGLLDFFYIDLTNFDGNTIIDSSKWVQVNNTPGYIYVDTFDTTLNKWETNTSFTGKPSQYFEDFKPWTFDGSTKKAYSLQEISGLIDIFDTVNLVWSNSSLMPQIYKTFATSSLSALYGPSQVLSSNGQILYFPSESSSTLYPTSDTTMTTILSYNIITNSWQFINSTGQIPNKRSDYTAVSTSDGRVIIYGGTSNKLSATPSIVVLNTSNYMWSTPSEVNPVGPLTSHSAAMVNNYMIASFGINVTERNIEKQYNKNVYKLDISNPLTYKWSLLSYYNDNLSKPIPSLPPLVTHGIPSTGSSNNSPSSDSSSSNNILPIVIGIGAGVLLIGILSFGGFLLYKNIRLRPKYIPTPGSNQLL
ncbi:3588_t:CDS:2 [Gigaspora rosea]|nr:3588_t:CDS:2 [Gigaspora rosea]